jgi:hypothetical protein
MEGYGLANSVPQGRLNLAQDAVLGRSSKDEKSRRDDWKLPRGDPRSTSIKKYSAIENSRSDNFFSRPCGTFQGRMLTQDYVLG